MKDRDDEHPDSGSENQLHSDGSAIESAYRRKSIMGGFDEDDEESYEEPDRDTDFASGYHEDSLDEEEYDDNLLDEYELEKPRRQDANTDTPPTINWDEPELESVEDNDGLWDEAESTDPVEDADDAAPWADDQDTNDQQRSRLNLVNDRYLGAQENEHWAEENGYQEEATPSMQKLPLGLIAVAGVALLLLIAGGYGVIQQRAATQEKIRELQAALATSARPADITASRNALLKVEGRNAELVAIAETLTRENQRLTDIVAGLESQLEEQRAAPAAKAVSQPVVEEPAPPKPAKTPPAPAPAKTAQAEPAKPVVPAAKSNDGKSSWFVNFSSYSERATAQTWVNKLKPSTGNAIIATATKNGKIFYRVRVVELENREAAEKVARQLEKQHGLSKLWIGQQE